MGRLVMNPLILIAVAVLWFASVEFALYKLRRDSSMPTRASFWLGLAQSVGAFALVLCAAIVVFLHRK
jgi:hypothetical protein